MQTRSHLKTLKRDNYVHDDEILDCSLGINPYGVSKKIKNVTLKVEDAQNYPPSDAKELREALAEHWTDVIELSLDNFAISCGSVCVLEKINKVFIDPMDKAYGYAPQFVDFKSDLESQGGIYEYYQLDKKNNMIFDTDKFILGIKPHHKIVYIDNPNNPTGQIISIENIKKIAEVTAQNDICLVVDEAYGDFMDRENSAISLLNKYDNIAVTRTFSKGYALAGLRIGYIVASKEFLQSYINVNLPFMGNIFGLQLAQLALDDNEHIQDSRRWIEDSKLRIKSVLKNIQIASTNNSVPIMLLKSKNEINLFEEFKKRGVIVTPCDSFDELDNTYVRVRVPGKALDKLIDTIKEIEKQ